MARLRRPQTSDLGPDVSASDPLNGFELADLLEGRGRPGYADPAADVRWREARRHVLRIADEEFDPRQILELKAGAAADWQDSRLRWVRQQLDNRERD